LQHVAVDGQAVLAYASGICGAPQVLKPEGGAGAGEAGGTRCQTSPFAHVIVSIDADADDDADTDADADADADAKAMIPVRAW
jgi:hypothetical protein